MSRGAALSGALLVTLASPATWLLALATFLIRGGLLLVALPIIVLPTPVGLGNFLAPTLIEVIFGGVSTGFALVVAFVVLVGVVWLVAGGLLAANLEAEAAYIVARGDEPAPPAPRPAVGRRRSQAGRVLVARLVAHLPLGIALAWGSARLVSATYRELTSPFDVATPIVWRVLRGSPEAVAAIVLTWILGQTVGAMAARRIELGSDGIPRALGKALVSLVRRPLTVLAEFLLPTIALAVVLVPSALAAGSASDLVRSAAGSPSDPAALLGAIMLLVSLWLVGLVLVGVVCAWRAAVWTVASGEPSR